MEERREHDRKNACSRIIYIIKTRFYEISWTSQLRNISMGGVSFFTNKFLKPGSKFDAFLEIPRRAKDIFAHCRVIWSRQPKEKTEKNTSGAAFVKMNDQDKEVLREHIEKLPEE